MTFGERLRRIRREHFIRQQQLAEYLNIAVSTLSQYENNKRHPNFDILAQISKYFNVSTDYLLGLEQSKRSIFAQNIEAIDEKLIDVSYDTLIHKMTDKLMVIHENNDEKSLRIFHDLYDAITGIDVNYENSNLNQEDIELLLSNHLAQKEDIDQTLNKLFRHHIKMSSNK